MHMTQSPSSTAVSAPDIRIERVTKRFHEVTAVDDLSLDIERGEFFSMLGPSGCGKTTTLRMIAGFEEVTAGTIRLGEQDVTNTPPFRRDVNTVFQNYALFPHLNVYENVAFGLRRRRVADAEVKRKVSEFLALVELPGGELVVRWAEDGRVYMTGPAEEVFEGAVTLDDE